MKYLSTVALALSLACTFTINSVAQDKNQDPVVAEVNGIKLTASEFDQKEAAVVLQAKYQLYLSERKVLGDFVDQEILQLQAKKEGLTVDQLLEKEAYKGIKDPTDDQLEVFYENVGTDAPFAAVRSQILDHVRETRRTKARGIYLSKLKAQTKIRLLMAPPYADIDTTSANLRGSKDAPVTLVEFADYECPYCVKVNPTLIQMEKEYGNKLAVVFKDFPLPMHKDAEKASEGARCAGEQGKYWEYHDLLFTTHQLDVPSLKKQAGQINLDQAKFDTCLDSGMEAAAVKKDLEEGKRLGLSGTPSFFVNGHFFTGAADAVMLHEFIGMEMPGPTANASTIASPTAIAQAGAEQK